MQIGKTLIYWIRVANTDKLYLEKYFMYTPASEYYDFSVVSGAFECFCANFLYIYTVHELHYE